ncbi:MAG: carbon starvation protein A [Candidatus Marinimicrobia bacterium]|jgi:carbon starvation protein|nr:carbon starvation protein A [Candidatus Neomarinimicrobiota bacterium]MDP7059818.1 carbon starvation protein A [Candidatus Neomarinimicrobiota bacterium]|tara:strand:- start:6179 stop:7900 length:1722 start_codon:yes stop_codon:yes gene_type:complete
MNSALLAVIGLSTFYLGYRFYSSWISNKIYKTDPDLKVPAHELRDNVDFVPTKKHILFGHHFTSIAGAAPIVGPCVAAYWGWLPACLWIILGTVFMGAVHDFGALVVSVREKGRSIADVSSKIMSDNARIMFLLFVLMLVWLVLAVFAMVIADLFVVVPSAVLPINIEIILAIGVGWLIYKKGVDALGPSLVALLLLYFFIWVGTKTPLSFESLGMSRAEASTTWVVLLFTYSAIASLLPVWFLLQPRDYINSHQLLVGLGLLYAGIFYARPLIEAPAVRLAVDHGAPSMIPLLFVTIACGAISGFHGLVASGTTSKQVNRVNDIRLIGYGGMLGEGTLALASMIAAVAGISLVAACTLPSQGQVENLSWAVYYDSWAHASGNKASAFVLGGGALIQELGVPAELAKTLMAVLVISFAATTLDTATRIQRFVLSELGSAVNIKLLTNRYIATAVAVLPALALTLWNVNDPSTGAARQAGWVLWPIFGASNQMLAGLTLMVVTLYFWQLKRPVLPVLIPMIFVMTATLVSIVIKTTDFFANNWLLFGLNLFLIVLFVWMIYEGVQTVTRSRVTG